MLPTWKRNSLLSGRFEFWPYKLIFLPYLIVTLTPNTFQTRFQFSMFFFFKENIKFIALQEIFYFNSCFTYQISCTVHSAKGNQRFTRNKFQSSFKKSLAFVVKEQ